jgi:hypothetical protein
MQSELPFLAGLPDWSQAHNRLLATRNQDLLAPLGALD